MLNYNYINYQCTAKRRNETSIMYTHFRNIPYSFRVDRVLQWLQGSDEVLPSLVTLYFSNVDSAGHVGGPHSLEVYLHCYN